MTYIFYLFIITFIINSTDIPAESENFYFERTLSRIPTSQSAKDTILGSTPDSLYDKFVHLPEFYYGPSISFQESAFIHHTKIFPYSASKILIVYTKMDQSGIAFRFWEYGGATNSLSTESVVTLTNNNIVSAAYDFLVINGVQYLTACVYREDTSSGNWLISLYPIPTETPGSYSQVDMKSYASDNSTFVNYVKSVGNWVFYCTESPNECSSYVIDGINENAISNGAIITTITTENDWYILDLFFYEEEVYGEITPYITFMDISNSKKEFYLKEIIMNTNTCFTLTNENSFNSNKLCTLSCYINQTYDSSSSSTCSYCSGGEYAKNNQCVTDCSPGNPITAGYCDDTFQWDVRSGSVSLLDNYSKCETPCANPDEIYQNYECLTCGASSNYLQHNICETTCSTGYNLNCDNVCEYGANNFTILGICYTCADPTPKIDVETKACVSSCPIEKADPGSINECDYCSTDFAHNEDCVASCPVGFLEEEVISNSKKYCLSDPCTGGNIYENGACVSSCSISGNVPNTLNDQCVVCTGGKYELDNTKCEVTCPNTTIPLQNATNSNADYCGYCSGSDVVENGACVANCTIAGNVKDSTNKFCEVCTGGKYELDNSTYEVTCPTHNHTTNQQKVCVEHCQLQEILIETENNQL